MMESNNLPTICTEAERIAIMSQKQAEAKAAFYQYQCWGALLMATGTGKTWVAIDVVHDLFLSHDDLYNPPNVVLAVPTEKLRDVNWRDEFVKWEKGHLWEYIRRYCYASIDNLEGEDIDLLILDEGHNITEANSVIFQKNRVKRVLLLTATRPTDESKIHLLNRLKIKPVFKLPLDEAVSLGIVAPYEITIVQLPLDNTDKYLTKTKGKTKVAVTERQKYTAISFVYDKSPGKFLAIQRAQLIYNSKAKTQAAQWMLEHVIPKDIRTLIFCGSIEQAIAVNDRRYFAKPNYTKRKGVLTEKGIEREAKKIAKVVKKMEGYEGDAGFDDFKAGKINRLSCINALNEGHNIDGLDCGFIPQLNSNELNLVQRIGRIVRYRQDHIGKIIILEAEYTQDSVWVKKATANLNVSNIRRIKFSDLVSGAETILFD